MMNISDLPTIDELMTSMNDDAHYEPAEITDRIKRVKAVLQPDMLLTRERIAEIVQRMDRAKKGWRQLGYMGVARLSAIWQGIGQPSIKNPNHKPPQGTLELGRMLQEYAGGIPRVGLMFDKVYDAFLQFMQQFLEKGKPDSLKWFKAVELEFDQMDHNRLIVTVTNSDGWVWDVDVGIVKSVIQNVCGLSYDVPPTYLHKPIPMWIGQFTKGR